MATRFFEEKDHAELYQKYRFVPSEELQKTIFSYLEEKTSKPYKIAVDIGCGSGQGTRLLAPYFDKVLGIDISEAQINQAKQLPNALNISYIVGSAEKLPLEDDSVDLLTSFTAIHWFDKVPFLMEVERVLKPHGCVAFSSYLPYIKVYYKDCSEKLETIVNETMKFLVDSDASGRIKFLESKYQDVFDSMSFREKNSVRNIQSKIPMTINGLLGYIQSLGMYQTLLKTNSETAKALLKRTETRLQPSKDRDYKLGISPNGSHRAFHVVDV
ncbi:putative methyltransferase DDB_G0268948 [Gracilinanus agilis]|uniref:putative methyltransferase DDB_G0268948 n=1 Tax=Gracilinanus agilis TaxID=191870 RepID=UPI001CFE6EF2|nr:putative methyltransferase DDB_G0268948 [Gracilinanus agilis]